MKIDPGSNFLFPTRGRYVLWLALGLAACMLTTGLLRHWGDPQRFPLIERRAGVPIPPPETYNLGRASYRAWWQWRVISDGDLRPILEAARSRREGERMYRPEGLSQGRATFVYSPFTALLVSPWASLDHARVADGISIVNHVLALVTIALLAAVALRGTRPGLATAALFALHGLLFFPLADSLALTQAGIWIFFALALATLLIDCDRQIAAGLALAVGVSIKPHLVAIPILLLFVPGFPRRVLASCTAGLCFTAIASLAYAGWSNCSEYLFDTLPILSAGYAYVRNQSFNGMLLRLFTEQDPVLFDLAQPVPWIKTVSSIAGLVLLAVTLLACRRRAQPPSRESDLASFGAISAAVVLASPVCWNHHYVLLAVPLAIAVRLLRTDARLRTRQMEALLFVGGLLMGTLLEATWLPNGWPALFSGLTFYGGLLLLAAISSLAARARATPMPTGA